MERSLVDANTSHSLQTVVEDTSGEREANSPVPEVALIRSPQPINLATALNLARPTPVRDDAALRALLPQSLLIDVEETISYTRSVNATPVDTPAYTPRSTGPGVTFRSRSGSQESVVVASNLDISKVPEQIHISLTNKPHEMVIMWVTRAATETSVVKYWQGPLVDDVDSSDDEAFAMSPAPSNLPSKAQEQTAIGEAKHIEVKAWSAYVHTVKLAGLISNTIYEYKVGDSVSNKWSEHFSFKTRPQGPFSFTLVTFADFDTANELQKNKTVVARLRENLSEFDFILEFGDITYADGNMELWDQFFNHIQPIAACKPWMVTVGNHEKEEDENGVKFKTFESRFKMPGRQNFWYSFNYGFAHFTIVSTEHPYLPGSEQYEWLVKDFEKANQNRNEIPWIIVSGHRALYGSNKRWFKKAKAQRLRDALVPLFEKYHVDLAIFGHCHAYERTHPIYQGEVDPRGTVYLLAGVAGAELDKEWEPQPQWSAYRTAHHGYGVLHVKNQKKLRFCYHRERDGKMWDSFTLKKRKNNKLEVRYDYENKFLRNWVNVPLTEERALSKQLKGDLLPLVAPRPSSPAVGVGKRDGQSSQPPTRPPSRPVTPGFLHTSTSSVSQASPSHPPPSSPRKSPSQTPALLTPVASPPPPFNQSPSHTVLIAQLAGVSVTPSIAKTSQLDQSNSVLASVLTGSSDGVPASPRSTRDDFDADARSRSLSSTSLSLSQVITQAFPRSASTNSSPRDSPEPPIPDSNVSIVAGLKASTSSIDSDGLRNDNNQ